jgi:profilin
LISTLCRAKQTKADKNRTTNKKPFVTSSNFAKMSWMSHVDSLTKQKIEKGAILGLDGSTWAASAGFTISAAEGKALADNFKNPAQAQANGVVAAGTKYLTVKADSSSIYGKKGTGGIVTVKTTQAVVVGVYKETLQPGAAATIVEKVADYLKETGY